MQRAAAIAVAAAGVLVAAGATAAVPRVQLTVLPRVLERTDRITIFGSVAGAGSYAKVTIQFQACGVLPKRFRTAFETTTTSRGTFSLDDLEPVSPGVSGVYRAVAGKAVSREVNVSIRASVVLRRRSDGRFVVRVTTLLPMLGKTVALERFDRNRGRWSAVKSVALDAQRPVPRGQSFVTVETARFVLSLPRGSTLRAVLPAAQAKPCYVAGYSNLLQR